MEDGETPPSVTIVPASTVPPSAQLHAQLHTLLSQLSAAVQFDGQSPHGFTLVHAAAPPPPPAPPPVPPPVPASFSMMPPSIVPPSAQVQPQSQLPFDESQKSLGLQSTGQIPGF